MLHVLIAFIFAFLCSNHEIHRILLVTPDIAVAHKKQFQFVLTGLENPTEKQQRQRRGRGGGLRRDYAADCLVHHAQRVVRQPVLTPSSPLL